MVGLLDSAYECHASLLSLALREKTGTPARRMYLWRASDVACYIRHLEGKSQ